MERLSAATDALYGASLGTGVRQRGESQCISFLCSVIDDRYALDGSAVLEPAAGLMGEVLLDPAAEIGDGITAGGIYSVLARADVTFDGLYSADIAAPGGDEVEDEYPYKSRAQRQSERELARIRSSIIKTAESITLRVENEIKGLRGELTLTAESLTAEIENTREGLSSRLELTAQNFQVSARRQTRRRQRGSPRNGPLSSEVWQVRCSSQAIGTVRR